MSAAVEALRVGKRYRSQPRDALTDVSFAVPAGAVVGLLGPNGAGKTTLVKLICGITRPTAGQVRLLGCDPVAAGGQAKAGLAVVHQETPMDNMLSLLDNLRVAAALRGLRWRDVRGRVDAMLAEFDLTASTRQLAFTLSGGQRRRVQLIRALLTVPRVLILDEPSAGLDVTGRRQVWNLVTDLAVQHGTTILLTSHYIEEIERNCASVLVIRGGRLVRHASPTELVTEFGGRAIVLVLPDPADRARLRAVLADRPGLEVADRPDGLLLRGPGAEHQLPEVAALVRDLVGASLQLQSASLEDAFTALVTASPR